jgi:hypothetical protein
MNHQNIILDDIKRKRNSLFSSVSDITKTSKPFPNGGYARLNQTNRSRLVKYPIFNNDSDGITCLKREQNKNKYPKNLVKSTLFNA